MCNQSLLLKQIVKVRGKLKTIGTADLNEMDLLCCQDVVI